MPITISEDVKRSIFDIYKPQPGDAPLFDGADPYLDPLFRTPVANRARFAPFRQQAIESMKGHFSWDDDYLHLMDNVSTALDKRNTPDVDDAGRVGPNALRSNFLGLRHLPGYPMRPATVPLADNRKKRADAGLADGPVNDKHEYIFRALVRCFFTDLTNQGLRIARGSSMGIPSFDKTMAGKIDTAQRALRDAQSAGELYLKGDFENAFLLFDFGGATYVVYREQMSDKISVETFDGKRVYVAKDRKVATVEYALSGGRRGELVTANKDPAGLEAEGVSVPKGFFATRRRTAMACPFTSNAPIMVISQAVRHRIYDIYAYTLHHTTRINKEEKVRAWDFAIAADVSDHDTFWPGWLLDLIVDELNTMGFAPWFTEILRTTMRLPVYVTAPDPGFGHFMVGDWRKPDLHVGLPSGIGMTDLLGSLLMVPTYLILQLDHTAPHIWDRIRDIPTAERFLDSYLRGQEEIMQISKSDDAMLGWRPGPSAELGRKLQLAMQEGRADLSPYMLISYEHGGAFLGDVLVYDHTKELASARFMGNINSYVVNMFVPEYGVQSGVRDRSRRARPFPGLAVEAAPTVYGTCPLWGDVNDVIEKEYRDIYGASYSTYRSELLLEDKAALSDWLRERSDLLAFGNLTPADHEVIAEPSKLGWKFTTAELSPLVIELVSSGLTPVQTAEFFNSVVP